jgi:hypothetical protein
MSLAVRVIVAGIACSALLASSAFAQDSALSPTSGALSLSAGFSPDPHVVAIGASAAALDAPCGGFVREAPDVRLAYSGADAPLAVSVESAASVSLLIRGPNGAWYCSGGESDRAIRFEGAQSGVYAIWIAGPSDGAEAQIAISASASENQ